MNYCTLLRCLRPHFTLFSRCFRRLMERQSVAIKHSPISRLRPFSKPVTTFALIYLPSLSLVEPLSSPEYLPSPPPSWAQLPSLTLPFYLIRTSPPDRLSLALSFSIKLHNSQRFPVQLHPHPTLSPFILNHLLHSVS